MSVCLGLLSCWLGIEIATTATWFKVWTGAGPFHWRFRIRRHPKPGDQRWYAYGGRASQWESLGLYWRFTLGDSPDIVVRTHDVVTYETTVYPDGTKKVRVL